MTDAVGLHDPRIQAHLEPIVRDFLQLDPPEGDLFPLSPDTIVALLLLGLTPPELRPATLTILPSLERTELHAHRLADFHDEEQIEWSMTARGEQLADVLVEAHRKLPADVIPPVATNSQPTPAAKDGEAEFRAR